MLCAAALWVGAVPDSALAKSPKRPVALVESIEDAPKAGVEILDYLYRKQKINLGKTGTIVLSYFDSCVQETITGGKVKVGRLKSKVRRGKIATATIPCQGSRMIVAADALEAGASVKRVKPFKSEDWHEIVVKTSLPIFKWQPAAKKDEVTVTVVYLDSEPERVVWQATTSDGYLAYVADAESLQTGMPYRVTVTYPGGLERLAVFSIDPMLDVTDDAINRIIPIVR